MKNAIGRTLTRLFLFSQFCCALYLTADLPPMPGKPVEPPVTRLVSAVDDKAGPVGEYQPQVMKQAVEFGTARINL